MGIISRVGKWLDSRFPEKISADEVRESLREYQKLQSQLTSFEMRLGQIGKRMEEIGDLEKVFDKELREMKDEMNKAKAVLSVMNRIRTSSPLPSSEAWKR